MTKVVSAFIAGLAILACGNPTDASTPTPVVAPAGWPQFAEEYPITHSGTVVPDTTCCYSFSLATCSWATGVPYEGALYVMPDGTGGLSVPLRIYVHDAFDTDAISKPSGAEVYFYDSDSLLWTVNIEANWTDSPNSFESEMLVGIPRPYILAR